MKEFLIFFGGVAFGELALLFTMAFFIGAGGDETGE